MQLNKVFQDWLSRRKITTDVLDTFGIHSGENSILGGECIIIPIKDGEGNFIFNKYRRNPLDQQKPKYIYDKGGKMALYGLHLAKQSDTILITEGEMDCLVAWSANIPAVSSTGGALSFPVEWAKHFEGKEVIICLDNDVTGGSGMVKILSIIPHAKLLFLPEGAHIKDISDYVMSGGNLNELIKSAKALPSLEAVKENRAERISRFMSVHFHEAYIKEYEKPVRTYSKKERFETDRVLRAKAFHIPDLIDFKMHKAKCLWHNESTASLHYFEKTNTCYCFGQCGRVFDAIDVYRQLHNCSFNEAINNLQK